MGWTERSAHHLSVATAFVVAATLATPAGATHLSDVSAMQPADGAAENVPLTVATDELGDPDMRSPVKAAIERDARPVFELYEGMGKSLEGVSIEVIVSEPGDPGKYEISLTGHGPAGTTKQETVSCEYCTETDLVSRTIEAIGKLLPALDGGSDTTEPPPPEPVPSEDTHDPNADDGTKTGRAKDNKLGPMGIAGAVGLGLGAATIMPGVIFAVRADTSENARFGDTQFRSTKTAGYALIGVGAAVFVTGAALLIVDRVRAKKRPAEKASALVVPAPGGLSVVGRF